MHKKFLILFLILLIVGCKKADDSAEDRQASASEESDVETDAPSADLEVDTAEDPAAQNDAQDGEPSQDDAPDADAPEAAEAPADPSDASGASSSKQTMKVTSYGQKPRRVLQYDLERVKEQSVRVRTDVDTEIEGQKMLVPRLVQIMHTKALEPKGDVLRLTLESEKASYEARIQDDPMHDMILESMQQMTDMTALTFAYDIDRFGNAKNMKILSSEWATPEVEEMITGQMDQMTHGFPSEAVGKGATWTTTSSLNMGGELTMDANVHYTLTAVDAKGATLDVRYDVPNLSQAMNVEGAENAVMRGKLKGKGTMTVRFDQLFPMADQTIDLDMTVEDGDKKMAMKMKMHMVLEGLD